MLGHANVAYYKQRVAQLSENRIMTAAYDTAGGKLRSLHYAQKQVVKIIILKPA